MIVLVGFMGAGKTTIGHILAERLGLPFVDTDLLIERREGRSIREIFEVDGEPAFRALERRAIAELLSGPDAVVAVGGGAVESPETRSLLSDLASVVYLRVSYEEALLRIAHDSYRPMLQRPDLDRIYERRLSAYDEAATITVDTDGRHPEAVCLEVLQQLDPALRLLQTRAPGSSASGCP